MGAVWYCSTCNLRAGSVDYEAPPDPQPPYDRIAVGHVLVLPCGHTEGAWTKGEMPTAGTPTAVTVRPAR